MIVHGSGFGAEWLVGAMGFWNIAIPAIIAGISALAKNKSDSAARKSQAEAANAPCMAENQRRAALGNAVGKAYGFDMSSPQMQALVAPRPCGAKDPTAGSGWGLVSDLMGGGAMIAGKALTPNSQGTGGMTSAFQSGGGFGTGNVPCPPPMIEHPVTKECVNAGQLFPGE